MGCTDIRHGGGAGDCDEAMKNLLCDQSGVHIVRQVVLETDLGYSVKRLA